MKLSALVFLALLGLASTLEWVRWTGSLPRGAVSIYNDYVSRTDYVCASGCVPGFYNEDLPGPHACRYAYGGREHNGLEFQILTNTDHLEFVEWKGGSYGSVPQDSVTPCSGSAYVGKNKYGLGKVDRRNEAFFLPYNGGEHWYKTYQVLTVTRRTG